MPQLTEVSIKNLRGLQDLTLQGTRTFNLIVGPSEIGKTTILEGIFISSTLASMASLVQVNQVRNANIGSEEKIRSVLPSLFKEWGEEPIDIQLKLKNGTMEYGSHISFTKYYGDDTVIDIKNGNDYDGDRIGVLLGVKSQIELTGATRGKLEKSLLISDFEETEHSIRVKTNRQIKNPPKINGKKLDPNQLGKYFPVSMYSSGHHLSRDLAKGVEYAVSHNKEKLLLDELQKINPRVTYIGIVGKDIIIDIGLGFKVGVYIAGGGFKEALSTLSNLCHPKASIFLIDEMGKDIYHASLKGYLRAVLNFSKREGKQIFATTHSKDMLIALNELLQEDSTLQEYVMCYSMARNKHGKVKAYSYDYQTIERCIANDIEIR